MQLGTQVPDPEHESKMPDPVQSQEDALDSPLQHAAARPLRQYCAPKMPPKLPLLVSPSAMQVGRQVPDPEHESKIPDPVQSQADALDSPLQHAAARLSIQFCAPKMPPKLPLLVSPSAMQVGASEVLVLLVVVLVLLVVVVVVMATQMLSVHWLLTSQGPQSIGMPQPLATDPHCAPRPAQVFGVQQTPNLSVGTSVTQRRLAQLRLTWH